MRRKTFLTSGKLAIIIVLVVLMVDQLIKIWVKTHMGLGESIEVFSWFYIRFIENNGMAWGMELGSKLFLTLFRLIAVTAIGWYIHRQVRQHAPQGYIICLSLIMAGAAGNIFDCVLYGQIFSDSVPYQVATCVPFGEGYAPLLMGKVVDMFYFPLIVSTWPSWMPFCGGEDFVFFSPIFNFADACITVGVFLLLIFYRSYLSRETAEKPETEEKPEMTEKQETEGHRETERKQEM